MSLIRKAKKALKKYDYDAYKVLEEPVYSSLTDEEILELKRSAENKRHYRKYKASKEKNVV